MKFLKVLIVILLACILFFIIKYYNKPRIITIESINTQIDSIYIIKDSIQKQIDTVYVRLKENNQQYEKDVNRIVTNDINENYSFFIDYISRNKERLDSINNNF